MKIQEIMAMHIDYVGNTKYIEQCTYPNTADCPICHHRIQPAILNAYYNPTTTNCDIYSLFLLKRCTYCEEVFLEKLIGHKKNMHGSSLDFEQREFSVPYLPEISVFSPEIQQLSPNFVDVYSQSLASEQMNFTALCGCGYRKSLEFLIKDYLCFKYPEDEDKIKAEPLSRSIRRIDDNRIKTLAERSSWIGNDEVHCVKKHSELDVDHMKCFIKAVVFYIEAELAFNSAATVAPK